MIPEALIGKAAIEDTYAELVRTGQLNNELSPLFQEFLKDGNEKID